MSRMIHETDITWALGPAQIWTSLEPSLGIVSSCLITTFRPIVSGVRTVFGLRDNSKDDGLSDYNRQTIGSMGLCRVPRSKPQEEEDDEEELTPYRNAGKYKASVTTGKSQQGVQEALQQDIQQLPLQGGRELLEKRAPSDRIQVETSYVVKNEGW
jgi:hypothetical protein